MTKNIFIVIGAVGFLSLSHAGSDVLQEQMTMDQGQPKVSQKIEQEQKESFLALKSFVTGAEYSAINSGLMKLWNDPKFFRDPINWCALDARGGNWLRRFVLPIALFRGLLCVIFDYCKSKITPANPHPYLKLIIPYVRTGSTMFLGALLGNVSGAILSGKSSKDLQEKGYQRDILKSSRDSTFLATGIHLAFDALSHLHKNYIAKKDTQKEDKKSQETQGHTTA